MYDTKSVWYDKTNQYDKFRLSLKFCGLPRKNSLVRVFTRNDRKMASFGVEFMNFYVNLGKNLRNLREMQRRKNLKNLKETKRLKNLKRTKKIRNLKEI